jgi:ATP-dependent protease ClpP protease subunit
MNNATMADEGDVLPESQRACYNQPEQVNEMRLVVDGNDPLVNYKTHFLNTEGAGKLSGLTFVTPKGAYIFLFSGISVVDYRNIASDLQKIEDYTDIKDVTMKINSPGGSAFDGLSIAGLIETYRKKGFNIRAEGAGIIASAAVPIFVACKERVLSKGTMLMVHEAALFKWPGRESASTIKTQDQMMTMLGNRYIDFMVRNTTTPRIEWAKMIKETTWMLPEKAVELGMADSIH